MKVKQTGDDATVTLTDFEFDSIVLAREDGEWKISDLRD